MRIESIKLKNYRSFNHAILRGIPSLCVIVGANGTGKSTLLDVFSFLKEAFTGDVQKALDARGGYQEVHSRETEGPIQIEISFWEKESDPLGTYSIEIDEINERPVVSRELLKYRRNSSGKTWCFLDIQNGKGFAATNDPDDVSHLSSPDSTLIREEQSLASSDILAIKGLAQFQRFPAMMKFGKMIEKWHISDLHISSARSVQKKGHDEHLAKEGENLARVTRYLYEKHPSLFDEICRILTRRIPGIEHVKAKSTEEGNVLLKFQDQAFKNPFEAKYVSDGTIKMFAYLVLLYDPYPHSLLCVEEPENQLYPKLLWELAKEFRLYANRGGQVFVSTHSPDFLNAVRVEECFWLMKEKGFTVIKRAQDDEQVVAYMADGDQLGYLWSEGFFTGVDPE